MVLEVGAKLQLGLPSKEPVTIPIVAKPRPVVDWRKCKMPKMTAVKPVAIGHQQRSEASPVDKEANASSFPPSRRCVSPSIAFHPFALSRDDGQGHFQRQFGGRQAASVIAGLEPQPQGQHIVTLRIGFGAQPKDKGDRPFVNPQGHIGEG
jgi:hypothetical protein